MKDSDVFLGVPQGQPKIENPDGVFAAGNGQHSLYDKPLRLPVIPGDYDQNFTVPGSAKPTGQL